jgi:NAD(P)-dependent dehydrogenase (short-subunit alcohol dehydrogenase family)
MNILIIGANGGIGKEITLQLKQEYPDAHIIGTYHQNKADIDIEWVQMDAMNPQLDLEVDSLDFIMSCIGFLGNDTLRPEKGLSQLKADYMLKSFQINCFAFPLILSQLRSKIKRDRPCFISALSAKVGSIDDNKMGGWHSYRSSKAALNMMLKNIAIEFERTHKQVKVYSIHPGTTQTKLSEKFLSGYGNKVHKPAGSAQNILALFKKDYPSGSFLNWDGSVLPW